MNLYNNSKQAFIGLLMLVGSISTNAIAQDITAELPKFTEIKTLSGVKVEIIPSDENRIAISGHSKEKVKYEVSERELEIKLSLNNIWSEDNTLIKVYTTDLQSINANESSIVEISGIFKTENAIFDAQEGAAIYAEVAATSVDIKAVTGGLIQLRGKVSDSKIHLNTGGRFFGKNLETISTEVSASTGAHSEISASEYCKATAKFGGIIHVYGDPDQLDTKTTIGGKILEKI